MNLAEREGFAISHSTRLFKFNFSNSHNIIFFSRHCQKLTDIHRRVAQLNAIERKCVQFAFN